MVRADTAFASGTIEEGGLHAARASRAGPERFQAQCEISSGAVEGRNNKANVGTRTAYGFRTFHVARLTLFHTLGDLSDPEMSHRCC
jgi:hypothetical protein